MSRGGHATDRVGVVAIFDSIAVVGLGGGCGGGGDVGVGARQKRVGSADDGVDDDRLLG